MSQSLRFANDCIASFHMSIDGKIVETEEYHDVLNPASGEITGRAAIGTVSHLDKAVDAAEKAFQRWRDVSDEERSQACRDIAAAIDEHKEELAELLTREQGKPLKGLGAEFEVGGCIAWANATADLSIRVKVLQDDAQARVEQHRAPIGVVGSITPWNWPLLIAIWHLAPAIRAGNATIIKPSPYTPLSTLRLVEIVREVVPNGLINCVTGDGEIGDAMARHPGIQKIVFTGSAPTGRKVMAAASDRLKHLTLELGGNDAGIVLPDADPQKIAEGVFWGAFINGGQTCAALKRLYVHDNIYVEMCGALTALANSIPVGNGLDPKNALGPLQNQRQLDIVSTLVEDAKANGARLLCGGAPTGQGFFYPTTLVCDIDNNARLVREEQFGPALPIIRYTDVNEAVCLANALDFGLAASVWTNDLDAATAIAAQLEVGTVYVNKHGEVLPHVPFGGVKQSGLGVEFAEEGLAAYSTIKVVNVAK